MKKQNIVIAAILSLVVLASGCEFNVKLNSDASPSPTSVVIVSPTPEPTPKPTEKPTPEPSPELIPEPTDESTPEPAQTAKPAALKSQNNNSATVYRTETGNKYHRSGCQYLKYSKIKTTVKSAKESGLTPCKVCAPPQ